MKVTNKITIHLDELRRIPPIDVMQGDAYTRELEFSLYSGGGKWNVPDGVSVSVAYRGDSGHGHYDTLPDGKASYTVSGNVVTIVLIPQVAAVAGKTMVAVVFTDANGKQIATFGVRVDVAPNPALGANPPEVYYNLREWLGVGPLYVTLGAENGAYVADQTFAAIQAARNQGRAVDCRVSTMILPLVGLSSTTAVFAAENKEKGYRVMIRNDGSATYDVTTYLLEPAATDEIYFDITDDGVISLKPEYRGEVPAAAAGNAKYANAVSDRGADLAGTQNHELPEEIVIPKVVEGIAVTAYAYGMWMGNKRIKRLTLPSTVKIIPGHFCYNTWNLRQVSGTEVVTTLGTNAFTNSGILDANFPALKVMENKGHFQSCADLVTAELGVAITAIPEGCFFGCEKLTRLSGPSSVVVVGKNGFMNTRRLASVPFPLSGLTSIGDYGFLVSRIDYDWDSLMNCAFGTLSTAKDLYSEDYWSDCSFTPHLVPLRSTFSQLDPRWTDKKIGNTNCTYSCAPIAMAMAYSALMGVELSSPEEFMEIVYAANPALKDVDPSLEDCSTGNAIVQYMTAAGFEAACYPASDDGCLQAAYDALAEGAVLLQHCIPGSGNSGHVVLVYGINANGELLCADPTSMTANLGRYEAGLYSMAAKNRMRVPPVDGHYTNGFWIVKKKEA